MSSPCTGDPSTCGVTYNRKTACYQVPPGFTPAPGWTTATGVVAVDASYCPDIATTPTYDANTGSVVAREADGTLLVTTTCPACSFAEAVLPWLPKCTCTGASDYCVPAQGSTVHGFCHDSIGTPCLVDACPKPKTSLIGKKRFYRYR